MRHLPNLQYAGESSSIKIAGAAGMAIAAFTMLVVSFVSLTPTAHAKAAAKQTARANILPIVTDKQLGVVRSRAIYAQQAAWNLYGEASRETCTYRKDPDLNRCDGKWEPAQPDAEKVSEYLKTLTTELAIVDSVANKTRVNPTAKSYIKDSFGMLKQASSKGQRALTALKKLPANASGKEIAPRALDIANAMYSAEGLAKQVLSNGGSVLRPAKK
jgi:hypothetical protein